MGLTHGATLAVALILLVGCGDRDPETAVEDMTALERMSWAFEGNPSERDIAPLLVDALRATGLTDTEENRSRAGSVLVSLRQEFGVPEIDLLRCVPTVSGAAGLPTLEFPQATAICVAEDSLKAR